MGVKMDRLAITQEWLGRMCPNVPKQLETKLAMHIKLVMIRITMVIGGVYLLVPTSACADVPLVLYFGTAERIALKFCKWLETC